MATPPTPAKLASYRAMHVAMMKDFVADRNDEANAAAEKLLPCTDLPALIRACCHITLATKEGIDFFDFVAHVKEAVRLLDQVQEKTATEAAAIDQYRQRVVELLSAVGAEAQASSTAEGGEAVREELGQMPGVSDADSLAVLEAKVVFGQKGKSKASETRD